ncbi:unnamed protein product [Dibothriocephalus latus]|uniref:Uncharacterized protein n=1 Tax=Dibothriocephalus latus TaxID=60516 RepID=A0A3P6V372_DIBLA|nr:unnamed protein product [Dibothriocephalus latus]
MHFQCFDFYRKRCGLFDDMKRNSRTYILTGGQCVEEVFRTGLPRPPATLCQTGFVCKCSQISEEEISRISVHLLLLLLLLPFASFTRFEQKCEVFVTANVRQNPALTNGLNDRQVL